MSIYLPSKRTLTGGGPVPNPCDEATQNIALGVNHKALSHKFRILQVASGLRCFAGTERHVLEVSSALASHGHFVTLACADDCSMAQHADALGLRRTTLAVWRSREWKILPKFIHVMARRYDIVHTHSPLDYVVPAVAARMAGIPAVVMTRHMSQPFASRRSAYVAGALLYDRIIAVSGFIRDILVESGAGPERIELIYNGIAPLIPDPNAGLRLREELGIPRDAILIGAAGRAELCKGFAVLLKAVRQLSSTEVNLYCAIFGSGKALESLRMLARELQIDSRVRLPGFRSDVHDLWNASDIASIPSLGPESFSYTAAEALQAGCPVVASRIGALPEVLSSDTTIFTEPGDVEDLCAAMRTLISSPELRARMQHAARQRSKLFAVEATVSALERLYARVLCGKRRLVAGPNS